MPEPIPGQAPDGEIEKAGNPDDYSRGEQSEKVIRFMDKLRAPEIFADEESKREYIQNLTFEKFKNLLLTINSMLRDIPVSQRSVDGETVALRPNPDYQPGGFESLAVDKIETQYPPRFEDKECLFKEMFDLVQAMNANSQDLKDIALLVSTGINAIHAFNDGNGRTSRLSYFLLSENYSANGDQIDYIKKILGDKGRLFINNSPGLVTRTIVDVIRRDVGLPDENNPEIPNFIGHTPHEEKIRELLKDKFPSELKLQEDLLKVLSEDSKIGFAAVYKYLNGNNLLKDVSTPLYDEKENKKRTLISFSDFISKLRNEDYTGIVEQYWALKKEATLILMRSIADPEEYEITSRFGNNGEPIALKDMLEEKIDQAQKSSVQEVNYLEMDNVWLRAESMPSQQESIPEQELQSIVAINKRLSEIISDDQKERDGAHIVTAELSKKISDIERETYVEMTEEMRSIPPAKRTENENDDPEILRIGQKHSEISKNKINELLLPATEISQKYLDQILEFLDRQEIFVTKFSTRKKYSKGTEEELTRNDSIYYVTKSGVSLRILQYYLATEGLKGVVQPFMEKAFYTDDDKNVTDDPEIGKTVVEYTSDEFLAKQKQDTVQGEFQSKVKRYNINGQSFYLNPVDGHMHISHPINRIIKT